MSSDAWWRLTAFGDSTSILPLAALLAIWLCARPESRRAGWLLVATVLIDGGVVAASKVLYMAWGVHPPGLDFIGLSGHSAMAFLFWPVLGAVVAAQWRLPRPVACWRRVWRLHASDWVCTRPRKYCWAVCGAPWLRRAICGWRGIPPSPAGGTAGCFCCY